MRSRPKIANRNVVRRNVRFGSKADMCVAKSDVRSTPNSDRESGFLQTVMSALPPKADMGGATRDVRFGPIADILLVASCLAGSSRRHVLEVTISSFHRRQTRPGP